MQQPNYNLDKLSELLRDALQSKADGKKKYSLYRLSREAKVDYGYVHRIVHGKSRPSDEVLGRLCTALQCSREGRLAIFHAAGYHPLDEEEEETPAA